MSARARCTQAAHATRTAGPGDLPSDRTGTDPPRRWPRTPSPACPAAACHWSRPASRWGWGASPGTRRTTPTWASRGMAACCCKPACTWAAGGRRQSRLQRTARGAGRSRAKQGEAGRGQGGVLTRSASPSQSCQHSGMPSGQCGEGMTAREYWPRRYSRQGTSSSLHEYLPFTASVPAVATSKPERLTTVQRTSVCVTWQQWQREGRQGNSEAGRQGQARTGGVEVLGEGEPARVVAPVKRLRAIRTLFAMRAQSKHTTVVSSSVPCARACAPVRMPPRPRTPADEARPLRWKTAFGKGGTTRTPQRSARRPRRDASSKQKQTWRQLSRHERTQRGEAKGSFGWHALHIRHVHVTRAARSGDWQALNANT